MSTQDGVGWRRTGLVLGLAFASYFGLWAVAAGEALTRPWWYLDDYPHAEHVDRALEWGLFNGRPLEGAWFLTFHFDPPPSGTTANRVMRAVQGALHAVAAVAAAWLLGARAARPAAFLAVLPFVVWPFNTEAVLWRSAGTYPLAALLALGGVLFVRATRGWVRGCGPLLFALAVLTQQLAAIAGLTVWALAALAGRLRGEDDGLRVRRELPLVAAGYAAGGALSLAVARAHDGERLRSAIATDLGEKLAFLAELERFHLTGYGFFPPALVGLHLAIAAGGAVAAFVLARRRGMGLASTLGSTAALVAAAAVLPWLPLLLTAESWPSFRVSYLAPLAIVLAWLLAWRALAAIHWGRTVAAVALAALVAGDLVMARRTAGEYVEVFEGDLRTLREAERRAAEAGVEEVVLRTFPDHHLPTWNPYGVELMHGDSKLSTLIKRDTAASAVRLLSRLRPTENAALVAACGELRRLEPVDDNFVASPLPGRHALCLCPG